ncbi:hypothetical protein D3C85_1382830 [compost metagenome]
MIGLGDQTPGTPQQLAPAGQQLPPRCSEQHCPRVTVKQAHPQVGFQGLNAAAKGRLRQVGSFSCAGEVQLLAEQDQMTNALQIY